MVYANLECEYYESNSLFEFNRSAGDWMGDRREYGIMRPEDKDRLDAEMERKEFYERRSIDRQLVEDPMRDAYFPENDDDNVGRYKQRPLPNKQREHRMELIRRWMEKNTKSA